MRKSRIGKEKLPVELNVNLKAENAISKNSVFDNLLSRRVKLLMERAPMDQVMDATAEIAKFELEDYSGVPVDYNIESLLTVDAFLDKHREMLHNSNDRSFVAAIWFGAFIGKVIVNNVGGNWKLLSDSEWAADYLFGKVEFDNNLIVNPTIAIMKSIEDSQYKTADYVQSINVLSDNEVASEFIKSTSEN